MASLWGIARRTAVKSLRSVRYTPRPLYKASVRTLSTSQTLAEYIVKSSFSDVEQPTGNLLNLIFENVHRWGSRTAVECPVTGRYYTYNQLLDGISKWAGFLTMLELKKGDIIAVDMPNCPEFPIAYLGALSIGVVVTTVNHTYTAEEIARQLHNSGAKLLVGHPSVEEAIKSALSLYNRPLHLVMNGPSNIQGALNFLEILKDPTVSYADTIELTGKELAALPYSSGTTGPPKGVGLTHNAFSVNARMYLHPSSYAFRMATDDYQEVFLCLVPFYHIYGLFTFMTSGLHCGAKLITLSGFEPTQYISNLTINKVEVLHLVPPLLNFLIHSPAASAEALASVRTVLIGAAPVAPSSAIAFKNKLNKDIFFQEGYGMTEVILLNANPVGEERVGSCGKLLSNVSSKIIDTVTGADLSPTETGEICVKTPAMMQGYFNNEEATSATIDEKGWLHTGDVGHFDKDGYLKIVDRTKELIKVKGLQVSPSEIEDLLRQHPQVLDVGVVGVPHERLGEAPRAFVVTKTQITEDEIHRFLEPRIARHKKLVGGVDFIKELPKTPTGKLLRRELKQIALS